MFINDLPDDCLLLIFKSINVLDILINCLKTCQRWEYLITKRLKPVKYIVGIRNKKALKQDYWVECWNKRFNIEQKQIFSDSAFLKHCKYPVDEKSKVDLIYFQSKDFFEEISATNLLPNLEIADIHSYYDCKIIARLISKFQSIRGIIHSHFLENYENLEMIAMANLEYVKNIVHKDKIKQICLLNSTLEQFAYNVAQFPNLERLKISKSLLGAWPDSEKYRGPILEKLIMMELYLPVNYILTCYYGFQFMDYCPAIQSAYHYFENNDIYINESVKLYKLEDLVIEVGPLSVGISNLSKIINKYPNLKHLAILNEKIITDNDVKFLISTLQKLVLLHLNGCRGITKSSADYIAEYCKQTGRTIKFTYTPENEMDPGWPEVKKKVGRIARGFNFMENCFYQPNAILLDPTG